MARKPNLGALDTDPRYMKIAWHYARFLAAKHGREYPALLEISHRVDVAYDRMLSIEHLATRSRKMHAHGFWTKEDRK